MHAYFQSIFKISEFCNGFYPLSHPCEGIACVRLRLILLTLVSHVIGYALTLISHANGYALTHYVTLLTV